MSIPKDDYYTLKEAAELLGVSSKTIRRRIQLGEIEAELLDGPYGEQYFLPKVQFKKAAQIIDVVQIRKEHELRDVALALSTLMEERDEKLIKQFKDFQEKQIENMDNLRDQIKEDLQKEFEEREKSIRENILAENKILMAKIQEMREKEQKKGLFGFFKKINKK